MLGLPSENERVALCADGVMVVPRRSGWRRTNFRALSRALTRRPDGLENLVHLGPIEVRGRLLAAEEEVEQVVVVELHQRVEAVGLGLREGFRPREQALDQEVVLEQPAPAAPAKLAQGAIVDRSSRILEFAPGRRLAGGCSTHQTARLTINSLILPIARVGFNDLGQTSTQFMIVWQRNRRYGSSRLSRRSPVAWSRLSEMKR